MPKPKPPGPNLKLTVTKGPSSGLSITQSAKSKVQIGRIVSGNRLTIKDPGISSKHLLAQFKPNPAQWTITDLDSSNGTILNSTPLDPSTPHPLSHGDVIKFGEETVIEVEIEELGEGERRRGGELGVIEEERELGLGFGDDELGEKRKRGGKSLDIGIEVKEEVIEKEGELGELGKSVCRGNGDIEIREESGLRVGEVKKGKRVVCRGRGRKNLNSEIGEGSGLGLGCDEELPKRVLRRGRVQKNGNADTEIGKEVVVEDERGLGIGVGEELGETRKRTCRGRGQKDGNIEIEIGKEESVLESGKKEKKVGRGRVKKNDENTEIEKEGEMLQNLGGNEVKGVGMASVGLRRVTRSSRRIGNDGDKIGEGIGDAGTGRVTRGGRMTRSSRKEMLEIKGYDVARGTENIDVVGSEIQKGQAKCHKRKMGTSTENCDLGENVVEGGLVVNSEVIDSRSRGNCRKDGTKLEVEAKAAESLEDGQINGEAIKEKSSLRGEQDCGDGENNGEGDQVESLQQNVCGDRSTNLKKTNLDVLARLEKMTFGEWLDYIEEYLPKQIVAETEEMIMEMRCKAEKFNEFMLQQKAAKGGGEI